ncbi:MULTISPECIES: RIP metalloprotease RseP [unclassified Arcicella]|uniref:RIP metalloprotease RseP n=1 Tax=unclassified Arcicella TaxID=2644986 RepID=UPI0028554E49|nr:MULTISPECIES: RIP metalloprotease RseP [unclassified Arcicella]MDR6563925.1 regulator of sigma E protease [Arcicella sp. BE51]MDR6813678.1 regulator of sigma E protease [Arcicella sp. BE140]MDR6824941.1 regulator of sigma E protease [Arcicella sp. BE139]
MDGLVMAGQLILGLSILVSLHEFGHYITAKWFKMRVDKFYLFFDFLFPVPTVLNFALFKKKIGDTEYGLGWFPLGGYVSIAGMIDETQDASKLSAIPEPWEFRGKPAWQRLIVMLGGIIVNVILGVVIYFGINYKTGNNYISKDELNKNGIYAGTLAQEVGFKTGDKILKVNGQDFKEYSEIGGAILDDNVSYTVERAGKIIEVVIPSDFLNKLSDQKDQFIQPLYPFKIALVSEPKKPSLLSKLFGKSGEQEEYPAYKAGLKAGDKIVSMNGQPVVFYQLLKDSLTKYAGKKVAFGIERQGKVDTMDITVTKEGKLGFAMERLIKFSHEDYTIGQAFVMGAHDAFDVVVKNVKGFKKIFAGDVRADKALSGPFEIAEMYGAHWDWLNFWTLTGLLSMALAFMNLLPIPALDGGHALFLLYEIITGRPPSEKVLERAQQVGTVILLGLMIFVLGNGAFKTFFK